MLSLINLSRVLILLAIVTLICPRDVNSEQISEAQCDGSLETETINQIQRIEGKLDQALDLLSFRESNPGAVPWWRGNQSTFVSFRSLSDDAKAKLIGFYLESFEALNVSTLLENLKPCTNLQFINLKQVELVGNFPITSEAKLTLPKLNEFELNLIVDSFPTFSAAGVLFFKKDPHAGNEFEIKEIFEFKTNIKVVFSGSTELEINHDFGELVLDRAYPGAAWLAAIDPNVFRLKKLTMGFSPGSGELPTDLNYLQLNSRVFGSILRDKNNYVSQVISKIRHLKKLHLVGNIQVDVIDVSELPLLLTELSFETVNLNWTDRGLLFKLTSMLLYKCSMTDNMISNMYRYLPEIKTVGVAFGRPYTGGSQCHAILHSFVTNDLYLPKLESIFISDCVREYPAYVKSSRPKHYELIEEFLTNLGLGNSGTFLLERQEAANGWVWKGKNLTSTEAKRIIYKMQDASKLRSWEKYSEF